jgi:ubiquinone/menaquinone biosynthesis C-methylase UbiE
VTVNKRHPLILVFLLLAGCATLKQCAYEGISRERWQQPDRVIAALQLRPGDRVADLGSGSGYFTFRLAQAVGAAGIVYAVDVDDDMIAFVQKKLRERNIANVITVRARYDDPLLPADGVDVILTVNTYHHFDDRVNYFKNLRRTLRPGGRIAIIDFDRRAWLEGLWRHYTPSDFIKREMAQAGYVIQREYDFLDRQSFLIFAPGN